MDNISKRFAFTLIVNLMRSVLGFTVGLLLANGLGVFDYGRFSFLLATFISFITLLDMGTSNAFYTFISKSKQVVRFYCFYLAWVSVQFTVVFLLIYVLTPESILNSIFVGENRKLVLLAFIAAFLQQQVWTLLSQIAEAHRETIKIQWMSFFVALFNFISIATLYYFGSLLVELVFSLIIFQYVCVIFAFYKFILKISFVTSEVEQEPLSFNTFFRKFKKYCIPLAFYSWLSFAHKFFDTWLLQVFGGAEQQAYYAIGAKIASISLLFTSSFIRILWKEVAEAEQNKKIDEVMLLYKCSTRMFYFISAAITGFLLPWAPELIGVMLGDDYKYAVIPFAIMLFYSCHQTLGQVTGVIFLAIEETKMFSKIAVFSMLLSIVLTYLFLSEGYRFIPGLNLGAIGLSLKMVLLQLVSTNISMYFIAKIKGWDFDWFFQIRTVAITTGLGFLSYYIATTFEFSLYSQVFVSAILYFIFVLLVVYLMPMQILNISAVTMKEKIKSIKQRIM